MENKKKFLMRDITAREIIDSRGNPTVEVDLILNNGALGRASVPAGISKGKNEALELRDGDKRYGGLGVIKAIEGINTTLCRALVNKKFRQDSLDKELVVLDGTPTKCYFGANALLGISMAFSHAAAAASEIPLFQYFNRLLPKKNLVLPVPFFNIVNGGKHASYSTDIQEFMIAPIGAPTFKEALRWGTEVYHILGKILASRGLAIAVGDEGGYTLENTTNEEALKLIVEAIKKARYISAKDIAIGLDIAANTIYSNGEYILKKEKKKLKSNGLIRLYQEWVKKYPIVSIEDGISEDDLEGNLILTERLGGKILIIGDDLFATNKKLLEKGIQKNIANSVLIKLNQVGTVSEALDTISLARKEGYKYMISHRSGETEDTTIADFAVGTGALAIKAGAPCRGERTAKYNRLLRIEEKLGKQAAYAGKFFKSAIQK